MAQTILLQGPIAMGSLPLSTDAQKIFCVKNLDLHTSYSHRGVLLPVSKHTGDTM